MSKTRLCIEDKKKKLKVEHLIKRSEMNNTTDEKYISINKNWIVPYLSVLLLLGTLGNVCGLCLFLKGSMRQYSCSMYFLLLFIFDQISLSSWIINRLSDGLTEIQFRDRSNILCKLYVLTFYTSAQASFGMLVLAMIDRLYTSVKIAHGHFDVRLFIRRRRFQQTSLVTFFLLLMAFDAVLFGSQVVGDEAQYCLIINLQVTRVYSLIDLCIYALIPSGFMLIGDIFILYYIGQTRARVHTFNAKNKRRERQLSLMLVLASIISLLIVSPYSIWKLLINFTDILVENPRLFETLDDIFGLLSTLTHAMHLYLFLIISSTMRKQFKLFLSTTLSRCCYKKNAVHPNIQSSIRTLTSSRPTVLAFHHSIHPLTRRT